MASKIALSIIAKNEENNIAKAISSVIPEVDAVYVLDTGSSDKTAEICEALGAKVTKVGNKFVHVATKDDEKWVKNYLGPHSLLKKGDKLFRFSEARNYGNSLIPKEYDWILWIDADDILKGKENIRRVVKTTEEQNAHMVFFMYLYLADFNPDGSVKRRIIEHQRERLFRNDGTYQWKGEIHETLVDERGNRKLNTDQLEVIHLAQDSSFTDSVQRNIRNLEYEVKLTKREDPRPLFYLAKAYFDLQDDKYYPEVLRLTKAYREGSGWPEERAQSWEYTALVYQKFGKWDKAIRSMLGALAEDPTNPSYWVTLAQTYMFKGEWQKALFWIDMARSVKQPAVNTLVVNPKVVVDKTLEVLYHSNLRLNNLDEAWAAMHRVIDMYPDHKPAIDSWKFVDGLKQEKDLTVKALDIARYLFQNNQKDKIKQLLYSLPANVASNQMMTSMAQNIFPPRAWKENEIAIFVGPGFEIWSPKTIEEKGSGGSEEAVYRLSEEFVRRGYKVTVFADPGVDKGVHNEVAYKNYYEINWRDKFNILISWRRPDIMDIQVTSNKHYLWLHDVPRIREFTPSRLEQIDKVIVLSQYHASLLNPIEVDGNKYGVPLEKLYISRNGVSL